MKIVIALNHPAHYYVFKYSALQLKEIGHSVIYVIRKKDILEELLISEGVTYIKISEKRERNTNIFSVVSNGFIEIVKQDINLWRFCNNWKPDLMIGTDIAITHIGKLMGIPSLVFNEDDYEINRLFCKASYPFATNIVAPISCSVGKYDYKKIGYNGIQKMAYLHPDYFKPDFSQIEDIVKEYPMYFLIRLVSLTSGHDIEGKHTGLNEDILDKIIAELEVKGRVFISNESKLNPKYNRYRFSITPNKMHHFLAYASLFIGDSQTMCAEAGLLGTPFIRFNDFVGKIEYLNEIEKTYGLGYGITTDHFEKIIDTLKYLLSLEDLKGTWDLKRKRIFNDKIDVAKWYTNLISNYLENTIKS